MIIWLAWGTLKLAWNVAALVAISAGAGYLLIVAFAGNGPVWVASNLRIGTTSLPVRGSVSYIIDIEARESCPGDNVLTMSTIGSSPPATVTIRRPLVRVGVAVKNLAITEQLPDSVHPGQWRITSSNDSRCPTRRQLDELARFDVEVYPQ
jgi:hypothetical protein